MSLVERANRAVRKANDLGIKATFFEEKTGITLYRIRAISSPESYPRAKNLSDEEAAFVLDACAELCEELRKATT